MSGGAYPEKILINKPASLSLNTSLIFFLSLEESSFSDFLASILTSTDFEFLDSEIIFFFSVRITLSAILLVFSTGSDVFFSLLICKKNHRNHNHD